ncbi:MAG: 3-coathanger stack domain-containing protein [Bacteroidota bacterium]
MKIFKKSQIGHIIIFLLIINYCNCQSITLNFADNQILCGGKELQIHTIVDGNYGPDNKFNLILTGYPPYSDTTIIIQSTTNASPLTFQLPIIYASQKFFSSIVSKLHVESTNPVVISNEIPYFLLGLFPSIQLGDAIQKNNEYPYKNIKNEYVSVEGYKEIEYKLFPGDNRSYCNVLGNNNINFSTSSSSTIGVRTTINSTYALNSISNFCGSGQILPPNQTKVKVNPFKIKIISLYPNIICEDRKLNVRIDYNGTFDENNQFILEIADEIGANVTSLVTTKVEDKSFTAQIDPNLLPGNYNIRVRGTSPDIATGFSSIRIMETPQVSIHFATGEKEIYDYKVPIFLRVSVVEQFNLRAIRFSDGTVFKEFGSSSGGDYVDYYYVPLVDKFLTVDSIMTDCGEIKNFTVINAKTIRVNNGFYIEKLPKLNYCLGEKVRFKINSNIQFSINNTFTAKLSYYNYDYGIVNVTKIGDSLEFMIPDFNEMQAPYWQMNFEIISTDPNISSSKYFEILQIHQLADIDVTNSSIINSNLSGINVNFSMKGLGPGNMIISDGVSDKNYPFTSKGFEYASGTSLFFNPSQTTNYSIKSISNQCGLTEFSPTKSFSITTDFPTDRRLFFTQIPKNICPGGTFQVHFIKTGSFNANDEYSIKIRYLNYSNEIINIEVGRSTTSPITIHIPENFPYMLNNNYCYIYIFSDQMAAEGNNNGYVSDLIGIQKNQTAYFRNYLTNTSNGSSVNSKSIKILNGETVQFWIDSPNTYTVNEYDLKINGGWYEHIKYVERNGSGTNNYFDIKIKPDKDTTIYLTALRNSCGETPLLDSIKIYVKDYIIVGTIQGKTGGANFKCQGDFLDVNFSIEGKLENRPTEFRFYFVPSFNKLVEYEAEIISKESFFKYRIKIPSMPYEGNMTLKIVPSQNENLFAESRISNYIYLHVNKSPNLVLSSLDGSNIAWIPQNNPTSINLKISSPTSFNPDWDGQIVGTNNYFENNTNNTSSTYVYAIPGNTYELKNVENLCGYGNATGTVTIKRCYHDLFLPNYGDYTNSLGEYFSDNFIKAQSSLIPYSNNVINDLIYSAKNNIDLLPGFEIGQNRTLKVEIKGCNGN